jgi:hypothetical protein
MDVGKELKVKSNLQMEMKSAEQAKVRPSAVMNVLGI